MKPQFVFAFCNLVLKIGVKLGAVLKMLSRLTFVLTQSLRKCVIKMSLKVAVLKIW